MFSRLSIIFLLVLADLPVDAEILQGAVLKGVILTNELSGPPMENVGVDATSGTNHTESDSSGKFILQFPQRRAGDTVRIIVKKEGCVVVNDVQLQLALPVDADVAPLIVIVAKEADREEMARRFYRLKSFAAIEETYKKRVKELEDTQQTNAAAFTKLQQERDQAKANAEKTSAELAKNQPGQSSDLYEEAKRLFLAGKIDEAIQLLNDEKLHQLVAQSKKNIEQEKKKIEDAVQDWLLKGQLFTVQFRFDEAEKAYREAMDAAPDNFTANFAFAYFSQGLNRYQQATAAYSRCLELARKSENNTYVVATLYGLGHLDRDQNRLEEARKDYEEALKIGRELAQKNPEAYLAVAQTLIDLGNLDNDQDRLEEALQVYDDALKIYGELGQKSREIMLSNFAQINVGVAQIGVAQGVISLKLNRPMEARKDYEDALKTYRELAQENPEAYQHMVAQHMVAQTLNSLGALDRDQNRTEEARKELNEALEILRELAQVNPETYSPDVAETLNNLGHFDYTQNRPEEARKEYDEALKVGRELAQKNPEIYLPFVAGTLMDLGNLNRAQKRPDVARKEFEETLKIGRELAQKDPETYRPRVAETLNTLGELNSDQDRTREAREAYDEALKIYRALAEKKIETSGIGAEIRSEDGYAKVQRLQPGGSAQLSGKMNVGDRICAVAQGKEPFVDAVDMKIDKIVEMLRGKKGTVVRLQVIPADAKDPSKRQVVELVRGNLKLTEKETYLPGVAGTLNNLGELDGAQNRLEEARKEFEEALKIRRELAQKDPETYRPDLAGTLNDLGVLDRAQKRPDVARKEFEETLKIGRELAQKDPETYRPRVAETLNTLGELDRDQKRLKEARQEFEEALMIRRELAQKDPETYRPDLADALNNLGLLDRDQKRPDVARQELEETLKIGRELAQKDPETYRPVLAETLDNLGELDRDQKRLKEARQEFEEALNIYQDFAKRDPQRFSADVTRVKQLLVELSR